MQHSFAEVIQIDPIQLDYATLLIAREVSYENLDIEASLARLADFTHTLQARIKPGESRGKQLERISEFLFEEHRFQGNSDDYYDPRNSFLNDVLAREMGIPITLAVVFIALAERLGIPAYGVGLPGHFIVGCHTEQGVIYRDPFNKGMVLSEIECVIIAQRYLAEGEHFSRALLAPQSHRIILMRILNNLRHIYLTKTDPPHLLRVLQLQQALTPDDLELERDIGILHFHLEAWGKAVRSLRNYVYKHHQAPDIESIRTALHEALEKLSRLN